MSAETVVSVIGWLRERTDLTGWIASAAFAVTLTLVFTPPVLRHLPTRKDRRRPLRIIRGWTVVAGGITLLAFMLFAVPFIQPSPVPEVALESPTATSPLATSGSPTSLPSATPTVQIAALPPSDGTCPSPHDARDEERVSLEVYWWCIGPAITSDGKWDDSQFQLKVRLGITANPRGETDVKIGTATPSTLRVLIPYATDAGWSPPPLTVAAGDKPECVYIYGVAYWAIPPNVNGDAQLGPEGTYNFASHWDPSDWGHPDGVLSPGEYVGDTSHADGPTTPDQRGRASSDLVFTLPITAYAGLYGIALFDTALTTDAGNWTLLAV